MARINPERIRLLAAALEPAMRRSFLNAIRDMVASVSIADVERAITAGDVDAVIASLNINDDHYASLRNELRRAFVAGGSLAVGLVPATQRSPGGSRTRITFTGERPVEAAIIRAIGDQFIVEINDDIERGIREVVADATFRSQNPNRTSLDIVGRVNRATGRREGGLLGNTSKDMQTIQSVRNGLRDNNIPRLQSYLQLESRNKRYDGVIKRIIAGEETPTARLIEQVGDGMSNNLLRVRGQRIARTNTLGAFGEGVDAGVQRIIDEGIAADTVTKKWDATGDGVTRPDHTAADGQEVAFDQPFVVNGSLLMRPRDRSLGAPAEQVINCRCISDININFIDPRNL